MTAKRYREKPEVPHGMPWGTRTAAAEQNNNRMTF